MNALLLGIKLIVVFVITLKITPFSIIKNIDYVLIGFFGL